MDGRRETVYDDKLLSLDRRFRYGVEGWKRSIDDYQQISC